MSLIASALGLAGTGIPTALGVTAATSAIKKGIGGSSGPPQSVSNTLPSPEYMRDVGNISIEQMEQLRRKNLDLNKELRPGEIDQYGQDYSQMFDQLWPTYSRQSAAQQNLVNSTNIQRLQGELQRTQNFGPEFLEQLKRHNPSLYTQMDMQQSQSPEMGQLREQAMHDAGLIPVVDDIYARKNIQHNQIVDDALDAVQRDGALSAEQQRTVQQDTRAADSDRGIMRSGMSIGNEILGTHEARQRQRRFDEGSLQNAQSGLGTSIGQNMALRGHLLGNVANVEGMRFGQGQQRIDNRMRTMFDPAKAALGRDSITSPVASLNLGASFDQSERQTGLSDSMGVFNSLMNTGLAQNTFNRNNDAGWFGGMLEGAGNVLGQTGVSWPGSGGGSSPWGNPFDFSSIYPGKKPNEGIDSGWGLDQGWWAGQF